MSSISCERLVSADAKLKHPKDVEVGCHKHARPPISLGLCHPGAGPLACRPDGLKYSKIPAVGIGEMLPTAFAKATAVKMWECCQFQCCQLSIEPRQAWPQSHPCLQQRDRRCVEFCEGKALRAQILQRRAHEIERFVVDDQEAVMEVLAHLNRESAVLRVELSDGQPCAFPPSELPRNPRQLQIQQALPRCKCFSNVIRHYPSCTRIVPPFVVASTRPYCVQT